MSATTVHILTLAIRFGLYSYFSGAASGQGSGKVRRRERNGRGGGVPPLLFYAWQCQPIYVVPRLRTKFGERAFSYTGGILFQYTSEKRWTFIVLILKKTSQDSHYV